MAQLARLNAPDQAPAIALSHLSQSVHSLDELVRHYSNDADVLARASKVVEQVQEDVKDLAKEIERHLQAVVGTRRKPVVTASGFTLRKVWDKPKERQRVPEVDAWLIDEARRHAFDARTGEALDPFEATVRIVRGYCTSFAPKRQPMKATGTDPDLFFDVEFGDPKIVVDAPDPELSHPADKMLSGGGK